MKRERNTFFSNYNAQNQSYIPNNIGPYTSSNIEQTYYNGPDIGFTQDIDNRLNKIERQLNRLDYRLTKLENKETITPSTTKDDYQNMYMI